LTDLDKVFETGTVPAKMGHTVRLVIPLLSY